MKFTSPVDLQRMAVRGTSKKIRVVLAAFSLMLSIGMIMTAAYIYSVPRTDISALYMQAETRMVSNCEADLGLYDIASSAVGSNMLMVNLDSNGQVNRDTVKQADMVFLTCPYMELERMCMGTKCTAGEHMLLRPKVTHTAPPEA